MIKSISNKLISLNIYLNNYNNDIVNNEIKD